MIFLGPRFRRLFLCLFVIPGFIVPLSAAIPDSCRQLIVSIADDWDSSSGKLQRYERKSGDWQPVGAPVRVLFGANGLGWGVGVAGQNERGPKKVEGDNKAPAGLFALGRAYGYASAMPSGSRYPYHQVTAADAWIENPAHPQYNQHVQVDPANPPSWFKKEQMKQNDAAHKWKLEIKHNRISPIPGRGSAIFFHIWRGPNRNSAGCTTMAEKELLTLMTWLDARADPHYVLLAQSEHKRLQKPWRLPTN